MVQFLFRPMKRVTVMMLLVSCLAMNGVYSTPSPIQVVTNAEDMEEPCLPCELLFSKLESSGRDGKLAQDIWVLERGEPKSGTGMSYYWATAALIHTCDYLQDLYGEGSCQFESSKRHKSKSGNMVTTIYQQESMVFEPSRISSDSRCSCETVDRVSITTCAYFKHKLPVNRDCVFSHVGGVVIGTNTEHRLGHASEAPCKFKDGTHPKSYNDVRRCVYAASCDVHDDWLQMAIFRDPRTATVSTFYHHKNYGPYKPVVNLDTFVARELPIMCQWLAVRYIIFTEILANQSVELWYGDAMTDPLAWHYHWLDLVGLQIPGHLVEATAQAAIADDIDFNHKHIDIHPGEGARAEEGERSFEDEVAPETVELADAVLRTWLPPVLLKRFGVEP